MINFIATLAVRILIANCCTRWRFILKKLSQYEGRTEIFEKILRLNLIPLLARSISLDSTFKSSFTSMADSHDESVSTSKDKTAKKNSHQMELYFCVFLDHETYSKGVFLTCNP
jgi:hypothetical protein